MMLEARTRSEGGNVRKSIAMPDRHHHPAACSLHDPEQDQLAEAPGRPAQGRRPGEEHDGRSAAPAGLRSGRPATRRQV